MASGGRYEIKNGEKVLVEQPTQNHKDGNMARDSDGESFERKKQQEAHQKTVDAQKPKASVVATKSSTKGNK